MRIGIDISQIVHEGTGVAMYVHEIVRALLTTDQTNEYVLFGASLRKQHVLKEYFQELRRLTKNVRLIILPFPPTLLEFFWNQLGIVPIEWLIGDIDVFWSSDWTQPPLARSRGITTIHDLSFLKYPQSFNSQIVSVQKRRLSRAKELCEVFLCDSEATRQDVVKLLGIEGARLKVIYPGFSSL